MLDNKLRSAVANRYRLDRRLGEGGMAIVYLAVDLKHDRQVALKVLKPEIAAALGPDRFLREIRVVAQLNHPHIVPMHDSGEADGFLYYVMPYIQGESLRHKLGRGQQLPIEESVGIARQVASALTHAHAQGLVHRDIKPENILLHEGGAMVTDFGIVLAVSAAGAERLTDTGLSVGTPEYMSPEQASGAEAVDAKSDIYSLGVVLYEMLAGEPPYTGATAQVIIAKLLSQPPVAITTLRPAVPPGVVNALDRALAKSATDRFATANAFRDALTRLSTGRRRIALPLRWIGITAVMLLVLAAVVLRWWAGRGEGVVLDPARIAVLYFDDHSPDGQMNHLAAGFTESVINELSQVSQLHVISRNGVKPFRNASVTLDSIVRVLSVGTLVEGSIEPQGDRLRVAVRLVDGATGSHLLSRQFDGSGEDVLALKDEITAQISELLRQRLGEEMRLRERRSTADDDDAWEYVQKARIAMDDAREHWLVADTTGTARNYQRADSLLAIAEERSPNWLEPVVLRGEIVRQRGRQSGIRDRDLYEALTIANRALSLDSDSPEPWGLRGATRIDQFFEAPSDEVQTVQELAIEDLKAAIERDERFVDAMVRLSVILRYAGEFGEARYYALRALEYDEFLLDADRVFEVLCWTWLESTTEFLGGRKHCNEGRRRFPTNPAFVRAELVVLFDEADSVSDVDSAWTILDTLLDMIPPHERGLEGAVDSVFVASLLARLGQPARAEELLDLVLPGPPGFEGFLSGAEAFTRVLLGQADSAIALLQHHLREIPALRGYVASNRAWTPLHTHPLWPDLVRRR